MHRRMSSALAIAFLAAGCGGAGPTDTTSPPGTPGPPPPPPPSTWNVDSLGVPKFVRSDYIELGRIRRISRFRSSAGHDYSDAFETCRSMKHYYQRLDSAAAVEARIYSPVTGTVAFARAEWAGTQVGIRPAAYPASELIISRVERDADPLSCSSETFTGPGSLPQWVDLP